MLIGVYTECVRVSNADFLRYINEIMDNTATISYDGFDLLFFDKQTFKNITDVVFMKMEEKLKQPIDEIISDEKTDGVIIIFGRRGRLM